MVDYRIASSDSLSFSNTLFYNFDNVTQRNLLSKTHSRSGKYALVAKGKRSYSPVIQKPLSELPVSSIGEASIGAWIYSTDKKNITGKFMFQITDKLNSIKYSYAISLNNVSLPVNNWLYVCGKADLGSYLPKSSDIIKIYYLNQCESEIFIDDVIVVFGKHLVKGNYPFVDNIAKDYKFIPQTNQPPYPTYIARRNYSQYLINNELKNGRGSDSIEIKPVDNLIPGNFILSGNNSEQILLLRGKMPCALIRYMYDQKEIAFVLFEVANFFDIGAADNYAVADINADGIDELICYSGVSNHINVYSFLQSEQRPELISTEISPVDKKIVHMLKFNAEVSKKEDLFVIDILGNAYLLYFERKHWGARLVGNIPEAEQKSFESSVIAGKFIKTGNNDNLLLLYRNRNSARCFYKLLEVDIQTSKYSCLSGGNFDHKCDTLYPGNKYFMSDVDGDGQEELISYGHSWRFDMKIIEFTEKGYRIRSNIDFKGYEKDHNPKYYEDLLITCGKFSGNNALSIITFCLNSKKIPDLPDNISIYSLPDKPYLIDNK